MKLDALEGEILLDTLKLENGSGWVTTHRIIMCEHKNEDFELSSTKKYLLKNLSWANIQNNALLLQFNDNEIIEIKLRDNSVSLENVKEYVERFRDKRNIPQNENIVPFFSRCWRMFTDFIDNEQYCPCGSGKYAYMCCIPRMPKRHIYNWYMRSQGNHVEFSSIDKFISLWIAFISWSEFEANNTLNFLEKTNAKNTTDREIIQWLKKSKIINNIFSELLESKEFILALENLQYLPIHRYIHDEEIVISNIRDIDQVFEYIYVMRCNLFHGHGQLEEEYEIELCFTILNEIFSKIYELDDRLDMNSGSKIELINSYLYE